MTWQLPQFVGKDMVFIGRGREGISFERFISSQNIINSFRFVAQEDDPDYLTSLASLDMAKTIVVKTAGCPGRLVPVPYTTPTDVFFELALKTEATLIGITGTKGKSTTTSLVHHILQAAGREAILCGNIGTPMIDVLSQAGPGKVFVIELGAYQTAELTHSPQISLIINLFHEHLDYFGTVEAYYEAKHQLIKHMRPQDTYLYNPDTPQLAEWALSAAGSCLPIDWSKLDVVDMYKTKLIGEHNRHNIVAAQSVCRLLGVPEEILESAPYNFVPLEHRLQIFAQIDGRLYVDDAISTTPESAIAAIEAIDRIGCMLLGGHDRQYNFVSLASLLAKKNIPSLVLFPSSGQRIRSALPAGYEPAILETTDMAQAVRFAAAHAPKGTAVVLSTASPSYGLWKDFEAKGDAFQAEVQRLR